MHIVLHRSPSSRHCMALCLLTIALCGFATHAAAASFDCYKATTHVEKMICASPTLSALDGRLRQAYKRSLAATSSPYYARQLVKEQRDWLTYQRDICLTDACLRRAYTARIELLIHHPGDITEGPAFRVTVPPGTPGQALTSGKFNVLPVRDPSEGIPAFNKMLTLFKMPGKVIGCRNAVYLPTPDGRHGQYGGVCTLQKTSGRELVEICEDDMVGHVKVRAIKQDDVSAHDLAVFTFTHCLVER